MERLAFLTDVPEGLSGGVYVNKRGEAVGTLSCRVESHKMTYAICLCSTAAKDFFKSVLKHNKIGKDEPERMLNADVRAVEQWNNTLKKQSETNRIAPPKDGTGYQGMSLDKRHVHTHLSTHACTTYETIKTSYIYSF